MGEISSILYHLCSVATKKSVVEYQSLANSSVMIVGRVGANAIIIVIAVLESLHVFKACIV